MLKSGNLNMYEVNYYIRGVKMSFRLDVAPNLVVGNLFVKYIETEKWNIELADIKRDIKRLEEMVNENNTINENTRIDVSTKDILNFVVNYPDIIKIKKKFPNDTNINKYEDRTFTIVRKYSDYLKHNISAFSRTPSPQWLKDMVDSMFSVPCLG